MERYTADPTNTVNDTGITKWTWFVKNTDTRTTIPPAVFSGMRQTVPQTSPTRTSQILTGIPRNLTDWFPGNSPDALKAQKVQDIINQAYPNMVNAATSKNVTRFMSR